MKTLSTGLLALALAACSSAEPRPGSGPAGMATKIVLCKVPPVTIAAADGTQCTVRVTRWGGIEVGDAVTCDWRRGPGCP